MNKELKWERSYFLGKTKNENGDYFVITFTVKRYKNGCLKFAEVKFRPTHITLDKTFCTIPEEVLKMLRFITASIPKDGSFGRKIDVKILSKRKIKINDFDTADPFLLSIKKELEEAVDDFILKHDKYIREGDEEALLEAREEEEFYRSFRRRGND